MDKRKPNSYNGMITTMNQANNMALDSIADSTTALLEHTKRLHSNLHDQNDRISSMLDNGDEANNGMSNGMKFVKSIVDDPSGIGIMKIAMIVFVTLCVIYFGSKITWKLFFKSKSK